MRFEDYRLLKAIEESSVLEKLSIFKAEYEGREERRIAAEEAAAERARLEAYRAGARAATSIAPLLDFIGRYENDDPEGLVADARTRLAKLQQALLADSRSSKDIRLFIKTFEHEDPAALIPEARVKLSRVELSEARHAKIGDLRKTIAVCKATIRSAENAIAREQEIGAISGVVSLSALHRAGNQLLYCEDAIPKLYRRYRAAGGKESLQGIR